MKTQLTLRDVLAQLAAEGFTLSPGYQGLTLGLEPERERPVSPWYVRLFTGLSAWIAALFLIGFLYATDILQIEEGEILIGLVFCTVAVGLNRLAPRNDFLDQLGLALSLAGQVLFAIGLYSLLYEAVLICLLLIILEVVLIWVYHDRLHRFISTIVITSTILVVLFDLEILEMVHLFIFALAASVFFLYRRENHPLLSGLGDLGPSVGYGATVSLLVMLILPLMPDLEVRWWWITVALLWAVLLFLVSQIVADLGLGLRSGAVPWLLAGCVILLIPAVRMPGILGALIVLLLGFWRNNWPPIGLAAVFLVFYLGAYYYSLEWTLLVKSFALMGTGIILLTLRYVLLRFRHGGRS